MWVGVSVRVSVVSHLDNYTVDGILYCTPYSSILVFITVLRH